MKRRNPAAKALERMKPKRIPDKRAKLRKKALDKEGRGVYHATKRGDQT